MNQSNSSLSKVASVRESVLTTFINFIRVHYFFTLPKDSIQDFTDNIELEIRLTDGPNFATNEPLATAKLFPFKHVTHQIFKVPVKENDGEYFNTKIEYFNVHLFGKLLDESVLRMVVGLKKDYETRTENISLQIFKGVYFPEETYCNCDPLPQTWLELFDK